MKRPPLSTLDSDVYRDMRWCSNCGGEQIFLELFEFAEGRVGVCLGCEQKKVVLFTRTTEAA
jgi:hypothetical protein